MKEEKKPINNIKPMIHTSIFLHYFPSFSVSNQAEQSVTHSRLRKTKNKGRGKIKNENDGDGWTWGYLDREREVAPTLNPFYNPNNIYEEESSRLKTQKNQIKWHAKQKAHKIESWKRKYLQDFGIRNREFLRNTNFFFLKKKEK